MSKLMCSTPRPKRTVKIKSTPRVVSIMASMDAEARHRFTERANEVSERNEAVRQEKKALRLIQESKNKKQKRLKITQQSKRLNYWLFSASFTEIVKRLTTGH
jgi:hypothetical protein